VSLCLPQLCPNSIELPFCLSEAKYRHSVIMILYGPMLLRSRHVLTPTAVTFRVALLLALGPTKVVLIVLRSILVPVIHQPVLLLRSQHSRMRRPENRAYMSIYGDALQLYPLVLTYLVLSKPSEGSHTKSSGESHTR
jgi:hypothetical protein